MSVDQTKPSSSNLVPIREDYIERVYAGWLGKVIGVRHGSNIEGWTYDKIQRIYGEIKGYLFDFKNFAADDDTNGPLFFIRAMEDYNFSRELTPEQVGLTWLNYIPDHHGFLWWGGYGISTENTAYQNLKQGIPAPRSGSTAQNSLTVAEQIGGQIFIDTCGLIAPGNPELAALYAEKFASVSHDGNGVYGARFIAACIAAAFVENNPLKLIEAGLGVIPENSQYATMTRTIIDFYQTYPEDWRIGFKFVFENFGYDRYPGNCHIIPNSAIIALSLLYSRGDFSQAINICNMCGWDTDCNVGNLGTIMGVSSGLAGIDPEWRKPINDFLCSSSVIGSLNIQDLPNCASYIARLGYQVANSTVPPKWKNIIDGTAPRFHFEYPGSTHAFRWARDDGLKRGLVENSTDHFTSGSRSLKIVFENVQAGCGYRVYHQTYYRPGDFDDSRYDPSFSPILYPGQHLSASMLIPQSQQQEVQARLYVKDGNSSMRYYGTKTSLSKGKWVELAYDIPFLTGGCLEEAGVELILETGVEGDLVAYLDYLNFSGTPHYEVDFKNERLEVWNEKHTEVSQFTYLRGRWTLVEGELSCTSEEEPAEIYTGDLGWRDYCYTATFVPKLGFNHCLLFRVQGGIRSYVTGLAPDNRLALYKNDNGYRELKTVPFSWEPGQSYTLEVDAVGNNFKIKINGQLLLEYSDNLNPYLHGQIGFANTEESHTHYRKFSLKGL